MLSLRSDGGSISGRMTGDLGSPCHFARGEREEEENGELRLRLDLGAPKQGIHRRTHESTSILFCC